MTATSMFDDQLLQSKALHTIVMITSTTNTLQIIATITITTITTIFIVTVANINMIIITITCEEAATKGGVCEGKPGKESFYFFVLILLSFLSRMTMWIFQYSAFHICTTNA